jgi:protein TonB
VDFAKGWRFEPTKRDGKPVRARIQLAMPFRLRGHEAAVRDFQFNQVKVAHQPDPPAYPAEAKAQGIQGTVVVEFLVGTDGLVESAKAIEGPEALRTTAEDYAKAWRFEPAQVDGRPVRARFKLTMPFRLR